MPSIQWNKSVWDESYNWENDGDEWDGQAAFCGQPYRDWKNSIVETFIDPNIHVDSHVLELAPGHGRWTEHIVHKVKHLVLVDLSPQCINFCRKRFAAFGNLEYHINDGKNLGMLKDHSIDFVWSYDSFVHMELDVIESYLKEFHRILTRGGKAIIHHANRLHSILWLQAVLGSRGRWLYMALSMGKFRGHDGDRSNVSKRLLAEKARDAGLTIIVQKDTWGPSNEFSVRRFRDCITTLANG